MAIEYDAKAIKKANAQHAYTADQIEELRKCMADPIYFIENYVYIQGDTGPGLFKPYDYQKEIITSFINNQNVIAMCARQLGKTTCAVGYLLWRSCFMDNQTILIVSNIFSSAAEVMERVRYAYEELPDWIRPGIREYNKNSIKFDNKSRIFARATTKNSGRGLSPTVVYIDEFAAIEPIGLQRDFWTAIRPTLAKTRGQCLITSTPKSNEDMFAQIWTGANEKFDDFGNQLPYGQGRNGFYSILLTWHVDPKKDEKWEQQERSLVGYEKFEQEYNCRFITSDETLINAVVLEKLKGTEPLQKLGQVRWYDEPKPNHTYVIGLDPSMGTGGDYSAIQVYELPSMRQIAEWQHNKTAIQGQVRCLREILLYIEQTIKATKRNRGDPEIYWTVENNSVGEAVNVMINEIGEEKFPGSYVSEPIVSGRQRQRKGLCTTNRTKTTSCARMKTLVENGKMTVLSAPLISELKHFVSQGNSYAAKRGQHDDLISASLLCVRILEIVMKYDDNLQDLFSETLDSGYFEPLDFDIVT